MEGQALDSVRACSYALGGWGKSTGLGLEYTHTTVPTIDLGTSQLLLDVDPPLAWVTFNRPEARNAMTWAMYDGLVRACEEVDATEGVRVFLLTGAGEQAFVAGTDIAQFRDFKNEQDALDYEDRMEEVVARLEAVRCPTIAVIRGYAVGAGAAIATACDLRVCATDLQFGVPIARTLGNTLNMGNFRRLVALVGPSRAKDLMFTARLIDAEEARLAGVANAIVPPDELRERAIAMALSIAGNAPLTVDASKEAINRIARGQDEGADLILRCYTSHDFQEGVAAFMGKRKPRWEGR